MKLKIKKNIVKQLVGGTALNQKQTAEIAGGMKETNGCPITSKNHCTLAFK
ncbi:hypothetical protein HG263_12310 [Pseudoalteromonas sp. JBTF-M23]|uniref:Uncharacterized protein n=1 Tax=Pseudoalteromonas caenipelagi TaxID=2726988 RepID=A0A849VHV3_9GAMM|nr:hypothetical protein [Pseudoalteromonas caenipelagi]NOU51311.1 hypothetical protein [Pseudoalteromonas caenipelagi]